MLFISASSSRRVVIPRILPDASTRKPNFRDEFFEVKENNDFRESRERDPEKVTKGTQTDFGKNNDANRS